VQQERIAKLMANRGLCSRREAERLIEAGQVSVDGVVVREQGSKASPQAVISVAPDASSTLGTRLTVLLHKPVGIVSTQPQGDQVPAWKLIRPENAHGGIDAGALASVVQDPQRFHVAGRLDRASRGLLVLTEDGRVAKRLISGHEVEKTYVVRVAGVVHEEQLQKLRGNLTLDGQPLLPMRAERVSANAIRFVLVEGRKHQIRRVCRKVGVNVTDLFREAVGPFHLDPLPEGLWRLATPNELLELHTHAPALSRTGAPARPPRP
jgi:23S rRNA pseudouridine2604 synthase